MNYWDSVGRWINTLLLFVVGVIAFDTLFRLLEAQEGNLIVSMVRIVATLILIPFQGMFSEQRYEMTALMAILMYCVLAGMALAVLRSLQATRSPQPRAYEPEARSPQPSARERASRKGPAQQQARPAAAAQPAAAQRPATRRVATRPEPASQPAPAAKAPTRTPPRRASAERPSTESERNGRPAVRGDDAVARRDGAAAANGADGATTRPGADNGERAPSRATDTTDKGAGEARAAPAAARSATDTTAPRDGQPRAGDGSDDRPRS
jgi:hypothetical protein